MLKESVKRRVYIFMCHWQTHYFVGKHERKKLTIIHGSQAICLFIKSYIIAPHVKMELAVANNLIK